jgi:methylglyoxal synthase
MNIALIAHDKKKHEMVELTKRYEELLSQHSLYATGTTGLHIMGDTKLVVNRMKSGPLGGDQEIGAMVANHKIDIVIFLRDPLTAQPHEPDVSALLRLCDVYNVALATNINSADKILDSIID